MISLVGIYVICLNVDRQRLRCSISFCVFHLQNRLLRLKSVIITFSLLVLSQMLESPLIYTSPLFLQADIQRNFGDYVWPKTVPLEHLRPSFHDPLGQSPRHCTDDGNSSHLLRVAEHWSGNWAICEKLRLAPLTPWLWPSNLWKRVHVD